MVGRPSQRPFASQVNDLSDIDNKVRVGMAMRSQHVFGMATIVLAVWTISAGTSVSRDRPGTPNKVHAFECSNAMQANICVFFYNSASEKVTFEIESKPSWDTLWPKLTSCDNRYDKRHCMGSYTTKARAGTIADRQGPWGFKLGDIAYGTEYCFRLRARRVDNGVVSEIWSNSSCARTPNRPAAPTKPKISLKYLGTQWLSNPRRQVPERVVLLRPENAISGGQQAWAVFNNKPNYTISAADGGWVLPVTPEMNNVNIGLCLKNAGGQSCTTALVSVSEQNILSLDGKRVLASTGRVLTSTGKRKGPQGGDGLSHPSAESVSPSLLTPWAGRWNTQTDSGGRFEVNFQIQGGNLVGTFRDLNGNSQYDGTLTGTLTQNQLAYTFRQPKMNVSGRGLFVLDQTGKVIRGSGVIDNQNKTKFQWWGSKVGPLTKAN